MNAAFRLSPVILADLLRQSVYSRLAGYEASTTSNDAAALALRLISLQGLLDRRLARASIVRRCVRDEETRGGFTTSVTISFHTIGNIVRPGTSPKAYPASSN
jgi:hypothetical protein